MAPEKHEFKAELKQVLDIIVHSLYSNKDAFLRELISNANDAIGRVRFESLTDHDLIEADDDWRISIIPDATAGTLTISDNGIGMSPESIIDDLGMIARSGTRAFLEQLQAAQATDRPDLIGQFGVGFYASFMVADRVTVISRQAGDAKNGVRWESDGMGSYTVQVEEKVRRGTDVVLHLREEEKGFLQTWNLREVVKKFSDFIEHPIFLHAEEPTDDGKTRLTQNQLNSGKAIWLRERKDITEDEYNEFYKHVARDFENPVKTIHYVAEGKLEFKALLFLPRKRAQEYLGLSDADRLHLYVQRVFITSNCEQLLPRYLRFVAGVVESSDLPLNVSRETLQDDPRIVGIRKNLIGKLLRTLSEMKKSDNEAYVSFYREFGTMLKEGLHEDPANRDALNELLLFHSAATPTDKYISLDEYIEAAPEGQEEIFYLTGDSQEVMANSPYLEAFRAQEQDVLLLSDPIDEFMVSTFGEYKGKKLRAADRGTPGADDKETTEKQTQARQEFEGLLGLLKDELKDEVQEVTLSNRLTNSAACLVTDTDGLSAHMERLIERMGHGGEHAAAKRTLELNAEHPAVTAMLTLHGQTPDDPRLRSYGRLLYEQSVLTEGSRVTAPGDFASRINELIARDAGGSQCAQPIM